MRASMFLPWLIRIAIAALVPTIACSGYYAIERLTDQGSAWTFPVILAYPVSLVGLIGLGSTLLSPQRSATKLGLSVFFFAAPLVFLFLIRI